ncbi:MAG: hypothetical protein E7397_01015 [Ruminococcaceae bacterium]|nr:hypothetical protein [Oscillospiraceae bacterium]
MTHITDKLYQKKWGVFNHYLYRTVSNEGQIAWEDAIESIDVEKIASQVSELGAGYYVITLCQGCKHLLAPNETYNRILGVTTEEVSAERDVIPELYRALSRRGIDLYLYFPSDGPHIDEVYGRKIGFYYNFDEMTDKVNKVLEEKRLNMEFIQKWASVLEEYAVRYGDMISGWWMDGFYDYFGFHEERIKPFYDAIKKGNPNAITAFNNGVKPEIGRWYSQEEFTAGEFNELEYVPKARFIDGAQSHILAPLGTTWGSPDARYSNEYMRNYIKTVNEHGGVVSVDINVTADGTFSAEQMEALKLR